MTSAGIWHRVGISAPEQQVYEALATIEGLSAWWTPDVRGEAALGGKLEFYFGGDEPGAVMEVTDLDPGRRVAWRCLQGADEWVGTDLTFDLTPGPSETVVLFAHTNWREPLEFMSHCSMKWAVYLLGLKAGLEGGVATPFPDEPKISSWM